MTRTVAKKGYTKPGIVISLSPGKDWKGDPDRTARVQWPDCLETIESVSYLENLTGRITIAE